MVEQASTAASTDRIMKTIPLLMKNRWRTIAVTKREILFKSELLFTILICAFAREKIIASSLTGMVRFPLRHQKEEK